MFGIKIHGRSWKIMEVGFVPVSAMFVTFCKRWRCGDPKALDYERSHQASQGARMTRPGQHLFQKRHLSDVGAGSVCLHWDVHLLDLRLYLPRCPCRCRPGSCRCLREKISAWMSQLDSNGQSLCRWNHQFLCLLLGIRVAELQLVCHEVFS